MNFIERHFNAVERISKIRTLEVLRDLPDDRLRDVGISPELLKQGVRGWPWRATEENWEPRQAAFTTPVGTVGKVSVDGTAPQENSQSAA